MSEFNAEKIKEGLLKIARNEIRLTYSIPEKPLDVCASRIGGCPAVPADFVWDEYEGEDYCGETKRRPLSFMAQINLKDVAEYDTEGLLPKTGILSFFYEIMTMEWGFDPKNKGCAKVYYFPDETVLSKREIPSDMEKECIIPELAVTFKPNISLPEFWEFAQRRKIPGNDEYYDDYYKIRDELGYEEDGWGNRTKLLGYPDVIQNPMEEQCERVSRGYRCGCPEDYEKIPKSEIEDIKEKSKEWTLLFEMGTIEMDDMELMFGDCGHIYFWIRKSDLAEKNFDNVWLILQCT